MYIGIRQAAKLLAVNLRGVCSCVFRPPRICLPRLARLDRVLAFTRLLLLLLLLLLLMGVGAGKAVKLGTQLLNLALSRLIELLKSLPPELLFGNALLFLLLQQRLQAILVFLLPVLLIVPHLLCVIQSRARVTHILLQRLRTLLRQLRRLLCGGSLDAGGGLPPPIRSNGSCMWVPIGELSRTMEPTPTAGRPTQGDANLDVPC